jgi:hypothetical protein
MTSNNLDFNEKIHKYSDYLDQINTNAYKNIFLLSNPTLSKNPYTKTKFLQHLIDDKVQHYSILKHLFLYFSKNFLLFLSFLSVYIYSRIDKDNRKINFPDDEVVLIDSFYGQAELLSGMVKKDHYFELLYEYMEKKKIPYYLAPKFYGFKNPFKHIYFYKIMKNSEINSCLDISYIQFFDIIKILYFIIVYPFNVIKLQKDIKNVNKIDYIFKQDLIYSLNGTDFYPYIRYLFAKRLSTKLKDKNLKVISWCEYQVTDKNFFRGLKDHSTKVKIYATQFVFKMPTYVCQYIADTDKSLNTAPDVILVTGKGYVPAKSSYIYRIGPALRYSQLYKSTYSLNNTNGIIVMLPYVQDDAFNIINVLKKDDAFKNMHIDFKIHPDYISEKSNYLSLLENNWKLIETNPDTSHYSMVISSGSGSMVEMVCLGISAIIIASKTSFTSNPMPNIGWKENWDIVNDNEELIHAYNRLLEFRTTNIQQFEKNILILRDYVLSEVSDLKIKENFDF